MSGVRCGTRLERLLDLRRKVDLEIEQERNRQELGIRIVTTLPTRTVSRLQVNSVDEQLADLGVTSRDVKVWALEAGLISGVTRGRVSQRLVDAYRSAVLVAALGPGTKS